LNEVLYLTLETVRISSVMLVPFCPAKTNAVLEYLGVNCTDISEIMESKESYKLKSET